MRFRICLRHGEGSTQTNRFENLTGSGTELRSVYGYDTTNRLTSLSHGNGSSSVLSNYAYQYDNMKRITQINHTAALPAHAEGISNFVYDKSSQLTTADNLLLSKPDENFQYDGNGNRTGTSTGGAYVNGTNNLTTEDATYTYIYDQEGNRIQRTKKSDGSYEQFIWDNRNRLTQVVKKNSTGTTLSNVQYTYDTLNRLVKRREATGATVLDNFFAGFDGINATLEFEKIGNGSNATSNDLKHRYLWGNRADQLLADEQYSGSATAATSVGNTLWALTDHLGTIRDVADFNGTSFSIVEHRTYDSFGKRTDQPGITGLISFGYTGKYHDSYTNTTYHCNRWYDPQLGKWMSEDPIGFLGGDVNLGRYVGNQVESFKDSDGLKWDWLDEILEAWRKKQFDDMPTLMGPPQAPDDPILEDLRGNLFDGIQPLMGSPQAPDAVLEGMDFRIQEGDDIDNSRWFEENFPNTLQAMEGNFGAQINAAIQDAISNPNGDGVLNIPPRVLIGSGRAPLSWSDFGDENESPLVDSYFGIGNVSFVVANIEVQMTQGPEGVLFSWIATLELHDSLGASNRNGRGSGRFEQMFFPPRDVRRGSWQIQGGGEVPGANGHPHTLSTTKARLLDAPDP